METHRREEGAKLVQQVEEYPITLLTHQRVKPLKNSLQDYEFDPKSKRMLCLSTENFGDKKTQIEQVRNCRLQSTLELQDHILKRNGIQNMNGISFGSQSKVFIAGDVSICLFDLRSLTCHCRIKRPVSLNQFQSNFVIKTKLFTDRADRVRAGRCQQLLVYATTTHLQVVNCKTHKILKLIPLQQMPHQATQIFLERLHRRLLLIVNWAGTPRPHEHMKLLLFDIKTSQLTTLLDARMTMISSNAEKLNRGFFLNAIFHERKIFLSVDFFEDPSFIRPSIVEIDFHFEPQVPGKPGTAAVIDKITPRIVPQSNTFLDIVDYLEDKNLLILKDIESKQIQFSLADNQSQKLAVRI